MTAPRTDETDDGIVFKRRDVLKTVGAAGVFSALGTDTATAKQPTRLYVGTKPGKADVAKRRASEVSHVVEMEEIGPTVVGRWPEEALKGLRNNPHIRYIEEEEFDELSYDLPDQILPWGVDRVDAEFAHAAGDTGNTVHVAISDSGIDADHPDLQANLGTGYATSGGACTDSSHPDGNCDEDWDDTDGHGTHVAGTVAAIDNGEGVVGVAPEVTLHAVKIFPSGGHDQIKEGLKWAADQGYDVVNMSHGGSDTQTKKDGIEYAANKGVLLVSSAGNDGNKTRCDDDDCIGYPAAYDEVIAVSNVTDDDTLSSSSSVGPEMDIAAPGDGIPSTWNDGEYNTISGTSMASPHVAGAGALLIADGEDAAGARSTLESTAVDIGLTDNEQGNGLLDVAAALGHDSANDLLEVETQSADSIDYTEARLNGKLIELTGSASADVFFEWGPAGGGFPNTTPGASTTSPASFSETLTGLNENAEYQFRAVVTNAEGSTERGATESFSTDDNPDPVGAITHTPLTPNVGEVVSLDASGSTPGGFPDSIVSYEWDLDNDGAFDDATGATTSTTFTSGGSTTVRVRVTDEFGQTDVAVETFTVNEFPTASFTHSPVEPNEGQSVSFDASGSSDPDGTVDTYEWDWAYDGTTFTADETTASATTDHTFPNGGDKTVALRVTDDNSATDTTSETFHVNHFPTASFTVSPDPVVRNEPATFDASGSSDPDGTVDTYEWDWAYDGTTFTVDETTASATTTHTFATGGEHKVALRVTDDDGATSDPVTATFTAYIRVAVDIKPDGGRSPLNSNGRGNVPVAVLHTAAFDPPARLDTSTVRFGDPDDVGFDASGDPQGGTTPVHPGGHVEDVDGDGDVDSVFHFSLPGADFDAADTEGKLVGLTDDGVPVFGTEGVSIVGGGRP